MTNQFYLITIHDLKNGGNIEVRTSIDMNIIIDKFRNTITIEANGTIDLESCAVNKQLIEEKTP